MEQLNARAWLLHWSLFIFFAEPAQTKMFMELALEPAYDLTMELMCRHLGRYLFVAALLTRRKDCLRLLSNFVQRTLHKHSDECTEFVLSLTRSFNFDQIPPLLAKLKQVLHIISP